jgi:hypothetical protein
MASPDLPEVSVIHGVLNRADIRSDPLALLDPTDTEVSISENETCLAGLPARQANDRQGIY